MFKCSLIVYAFIALVGCKNSVKRSTLSTSVALDTTQVKEGNTQIKSYKGYFDFDQVDYYHLTDTVREKNLFDDEQFEREDSLLSKVYFDFYIDKVLVGQYEKLGYTKYAVNKQCFSILSYIFSKKKDYKLVSNTDCLPMYRDIYVFKRDGAITGIAKICFQCRHSVFLGTNKGFGFGMSGEYQQLEEVSEKIKDL